MESIRQTVTFDCPAHAFYEAFMDADEQAEIIGAPVELTAAIGGQYRAFNGELEGEFTQLIPDEMIVMRWRSNLGDWPEDHFAVAQMELFQSADGTAVEFELSDVPADLAEAISIGWEELFWQPFEAHFAW